MVAGDACLAAGIEVDVVAGKYPKDVVANFNGVRGCCHTDRIADGLVGCVVDHLRVIAGVGLRFVEQNPLVGVGIDEVVFDLAVEGIAAVARSGVDSDGVGVCHVADGLCISHEVDADVGVVVNAVVDDRRAAAIAG